LKASFILKHTQSFIYLSNTRSQFWVLLQLVPETENGFHIIQGHRTGTHILQETDGH